MTLILQPQEIALDDPDSCYTFRPSLAKPFVATPAAIDRFGVETILACLQQLQTKARQLGGLDYLQVFADPATDDALWFMEDGDGGAITALLPSDH